MAQAQRKAMQEMLVAQELTTKGDLKDFEYRLTVRLGTMMVASIAITAALVKLL